MATLNEGALSDYWANAIGGGLGYRTASFRGFQLGVRGVFHYNVASSNLLATDSLAGKSSRYERQLFDVEHPENRYDLDRLEELFIQYRWRKSLLRWGKMEVHTPLVNLRDARMKPYVMSGFWGEFGELPRTQVSLGWFSRTSPRSTTNWYSLSDAIGIYGNGRTPEGDLADYRGKVASKGIGILGVETKLVKHFRLVGWNYLLENVMNTVLLQGEYSRKRWTLGLQYLRQDPFIHRRQEGDVAVYFPGDNRSHLISSRAQYESGAFRMAVNYTRITGRGRFIFPREIGREEFYGSIPRNRFEGMGDVHAVTANVRFCHPRHPELELRADLGRFYTRGGAEDFALNKYGLVSHDQAGVDVRYHFGRVLKGLEMRLLYVWRRNHDDFPGNYNLTFNKSNFHHLNLITNVTF